METFYDADGNPVKVVVHDGFTETDTNSVTRKTPALQPDVGEHLRSSGRNAYRRRQSIRDDRSRQRRRHSRRRPRRLRCPVPCLVRGRTPGKSYTGTSINPSAPRSPRLSRGRAAPFRADVRDPSASSSRSSIRGSRGVHTASQTKMNPIRGSFEKYVLLTARRREPC